MTGKPIAEPALSADTQATLLLCARFAPREKVDPLGVREYNRVIDLLQMRSESPASLLVADASAFDWSSAGVDAARIEALLARTMALGLATERWANGGLWVISRSDASYPRKLCEHLGRSAPPLLWGVGDVSLADSGGIAIVGSRNLDDAGASWTRDVAAECARQQFTVISGGARGTDQIAMSSALGEGGRVVAVLPEGLGRPSVVSRYREAVLEDRLVLLSPFYPDAGFTVGNAMSRNKILYALADAAVVVRADLRSGGTWAGAEEELKRERAIAMFVRAEGEIGDGNSALLRLGARQFPPRPWTNLRASLASLENAPVIRDAPAKARKTEGSDVREALLRELEAPRTLRQLAAALNQNSKTLKVLVKQLIKDAKVVKSNHVRYVRSGAGAEAVKPRQTSLFGGEKNG